MTLATCAKDLKFYTWPGVSLAGIYETSSDCVCIKSLSWCNDGKQVVAVNGRDPPVIVQAPATTDAKLDKKLEPHIRLKHISALVATFSNTVNTSIAFGGLNGEVFIYDLRKKRKINEYQELPCAANFMEFSYEDGFLAVGCNNGQIVLYNSNPKPCATYMVPYSYSLSAMSFDKSSFNYLAAGSKESIMTVWDTLKASVVITGKHHTGVITDLGFINNTITTVGTDGKFITYDLRRAEYTSCYNLNSPLTGIAFLPDSYELAISTSDGQLRAYDRRHMGSPVNTVLAYSSPIKKICFGVAMLKVLSSIPASAGDGSLIEPSEKVTTLDVPASGDFSPIYCSGTSSTILTNQEIKPEQPGENMYLLHDTLPPSASQVNVANIEKISIGELKKFAQDMEDFVRMSKNQTEELVMHNFYNMRIQVSKQFIELGDKVTKSWDNFVECLKNQGSEVNGSSFDSEQKTATKASRTSSRPIVSSRKESL